jgi:hypothetical protein
MKVSFIRKLLAHYGVERIYLVPEGKNINKKWLLGSLEIKINIMILRN